MDHFNYHQGVLHAENVAIPDIASEYGTPCYVYSRATLERHWRAFDDALGAQPHLICYAVKANSNLAILNLFARLGSGFDIVSEGELERVLQAGGEPGKIVFSGVGKKPHEMRRALELGIRCFNVESESELLCLNRVAQELDRVAPVSLRINPDVDAQTHPYISTGLKENKFGIEFGHAEAVYQQASQMSHIRVEGIDCHIGSQLLSLEPFMDALTRLLDLVERLKDKGIAIHHIDVGGGLGVRYNDETPPSPADYTQHLFQEERLRDYEILIEPGRAIAANAGILVTQVDYLKHTQHKDFAIVDAAMNDLLRPSLYSAWQAIIPVVQGLPEKTKNYDIVGPVCESSDFLGKERELSLSKGDLLAVRSVGAYGFVMASNYNSRPRVSEIMVDGSQAYVVRERETLQDLWRGEAILPE